MKLSSFFNPAQNHKKGEYSFLASDAVNSYGIKASDKSIKRVGYMLPMGASGSDDLGDQNTTAKPDLHTRMVKNSSEL